MVKTSVIESDSLFDVSWWLSSPTSVQADKKAQVFSPLASGGSSNYAVPSFIHDKSLVSLFSLLFQDIFRSPWEPALLSSESLIMWVINLFTSSRGMCGIISLNIWTKLWVRVHIACRGCWQACALGFAGLCCTYKILPSFCLDITNCLRSSCYNKIP